MTYPQPKEVLNLLPDHKDEIIEIKDTLEEANWATINMLVGELPKTWP